MAAATEDDCEWPDAGRPLAAGAVGIER
jgi:hypothetical protein